MSTNGAATAGQPTQPRKEPYTGPRYTFAHPQLGELTGRLIASPHFPGHPVVQFRSIPYATVPKRFLPSRPLSRIPVDFDARPHRDFTTYGAACPQPRDTWWDPYGGPLEDDKGIEVDEFTCLTATISVPEAQLSSPEELKKLPVMVYVHGGAAQEGVGHVDGLHSNAPITSYSASISQPVITVNIGYRLNWLGSLVCQDMLEEYAANPTSPHGPFNLTLQDQRNAFFWIQKFIAGFGGDASDITAFGESAGAILLSYHICGSSARLFDRAILQSGIVVGDLPFELRELEYQGLLNHFGIEGVTPAERLEALRQVDAGTLARYASNHITPYIGPVPGVKVEDSLFSRGPVTVTSQMDLFPSCEWLRDIILGDDFWEGHVAYSALKTLPLTLFVQTVRTLFPSTEADALLAAYAIPGSGDLDANRASMQISLFYGDLMFSAGCHKLSKVLSTHGASQKRHVYRYSFGLSNPFPGSEHSFVVGHHFVEILFVFLTLLDRYPTHRNGWLQKQACETARRWINFANGEEPWSPYLDPISGADEMQAKIAICDDRVGWMVRTVKEDEEVSKQDPWGERRYAGWRAMQSAFDALRADGDVDVVFGQKVNMARLQLFQLALQHSRLSNSFQTP